MIKMNELRFTNLVEYNGENKCVAELFNISNSRQWNAIPLTEELFKRLGCKVYGEDWLLPKVGKNQYRIRVIQITDDTYGWNINMFRDVEFKYVHTLQNLYFTITGQELEYKD